MAYQFNAFANTAIVAGDGTMITFAATEGMPAGYEIRLKGSSLAYNSTTGVMTGTITTIELYDPAFGAAGGARQTISIAAADQAGLAGNISAFLGAGLGMIADTFTAWNLIGNGFDHTGNVTFDPGGQFLTLQLLDSTDEFIGTLMIEGTNLTDATLSSSGTITKILLLDGASNTLQSVDYTTTPKSASAFEYGLLSLGLPDPEGGLQGNEEAFYPVLVAGNNTITKFDNTTGYNSFDGGAGNDVFTSTSGGTVDYFGAPSAVTINLQLGTATGQGSDTWTAGSLGGALGSNFDDTISGGTTFDSYMRGNAGGDTINGFAGHDTLDGGDGDDTLNGGDGDDFFSAGTGGDTIHGGANAGVAPDGSTNENDTLTYTRVAVSESMIREADGDLGQGNEEATAGIQVVYSGSGAGTVSGYLGNYFGTDTFDGIEEILGTNQIDSFDATGAAAGDTNIFSGMGGSDFFEGGAGRDIVNYDRELLDRTNLDHFLNGTATVHGVIVNMSNANLTLIPFEGNLVNIQANTARDTYTSTDSLVSIDDVYGTQFGDHFIGSATANVFVGKEGVDIFVGGAGDDTIWTGIETNLDDGSAAEYIDYRRDGGAVGAGITAVVIQNDDFVTVTDTHGDSDTIYGYVTIIGTDYDDEFAGNAFTNRFAGGRGDDTYVSGGGGNIYGGDQLSYLFEDQGASAFGIVYDAALPVGQIKTNDATDTFWGTDNLAGFTSVWLEATQFGDILTAGAGNDVLLASIGEDTIDGGGGTGDVLSYLDFRSAARSQGVVYTASLVAGAGTVFDGGGDIDTYTNIELLSGSMKDDFYTGSTLNETFLGHGGNDSFDGGGGTDTVSYAFDGIAAFGLGIELERLNTGAGIHGIFVDLDAGNGNGIFENFNVAGDEDLDTFTGINNIIGSDFNDDITGNANANRLDGGKGNDLLEGRAGDDTYIVDSTLDVVVEALTSGTDTIFTSVTLTAALAANVERLTLLAGAVNGTGNALANTITGNTAANTLDGGAGIDTLIGSTGNDIYKVTTGDIITDVTGQGTADRAKASQSYVLGSTANIEFLETVLSTATTTMNLTGNGLASQTITGNNGINTINGLGGIDIISGLSGNDVLNGGLGNDRLTGGAGLDTFFFNTALSTTANKDTILDFYAPQDTIRLENTGIFTALGATIGTLSAAKFWSSTTGVAHDADDRIIYNKLTGVLTYDNNGSAAGGAIQFAVLSTKPAITNADFFVI